MLNQEESGLIAEFIKWVWLGLLAAGGYIWKTLSNQVEDNAKALSDHINEEAESHERFVTHQYMQDEIKPWLIRLEGDMKILVSQTADVIKREEYKSDIGILHKKIDDVKDLTRGK